MLNLLPLRNFELEEALRAAPDDLDAYEVYADWLLERGIPHGELISFAVRRRRQNDDGTASFELLAAEARLVQDRTRMFGAIGALPRHLVHIDLELGFLAAVRIYAKGKDAVAALHAVITERAGALVHEIGVVEESKTKDPYVLDDRKTARAIWKLLEEIPLPRTVASIAVPLVSTPPPAHFEALAHVKHCAFPVRSLPVIADNLRRLPALETLTLTTNRWLEPLMMEALTEHAPVLTGVPHIRIRTQYTPREYREALQKRLPQLTIDS